MGLRSTSRRAAAAAILLGDQPGVSAQIIDRVVAAFRAPGGAARWRAARPEYSASGGGRVPGHPVLLSRRIWSELDELHGDQGARVVLAARPEWLLAVEVEGEPPDDIDTPDDYRRAVDASR